MNSKRRTAALTDTLYIGNLGNIIARTDISAVRLVVTSPPYMNYRDYDNKKVFKSSEDWMQFCYNTIVTLVHNIRDDGVVWWNTASGYANGGKLPAIYKLVHLLDTTGDVHLVEEIPWIKKSSPPKKFSNRPYACYEHNFLFAKNIKAVKYFVDNVRVPYAEATIQRYKYTMANVRGDEKGEFTGVRKVELNPLGASPPNYLLLPQDTTKRKHPAAMLPALANWAIRAYTEEGDIVLDPMCGIGTTLVEAARLDRRYIGMDLNKLYVQKASEALHRLKEGVDPYKKPKEAV